MISHKHKFIFIHINKTAGTSVVNSLKPFVESYIPRRKRKCVDKHKSINDMLNEETKHYLDQLKNFGHEGEDSVLSTGINGKMSEFNAALGILQLDKIDEVIAGRRKVDELYRDRLREVDGIYCLEATEERISNYSYFPILVKPEYPVNRDVLCEELKAIGVHPRKYFHPLICHHFVLF